MALKDLLLTEYDHEVGTTRKLLEPLPDAELAWKPHEKSMPGGQATHLSNIPSWAGPLLNESSFDLADASPNLEPKASRGAILEVFESSTRQARAWMGGS